jgi:hypothetical protein
MVTVPVLLMVLLVLEVLLLVVVVLLVLEVLLLVVVVLLLLLEAKLLSAARRTSKYAVIRTPAWFLVITVDIYSVVLPLEASIVVVKVGT